MINYLALYLLNPLLALILSVRTGGFKAIRVILFLYILFIGATFIVSDDTDIEAYYEKFYESHQVWNTSGLDGAFQNFKNDFTKSSELFMPAIVFLGSYFSDSNYLFTFLVSIFVGIAISKVYYVISTKYIFTSSYFSSLIVLFFIFMCGPVWSINGRFWLAFWFFLYLLLQYFQDRKWRYILLTGLIILIHNGFLLAIFILLFFELSRDLPWARVLYFCMIIGAYFGSLYANELILDYSSVLGGGYEEKAILYSKNVIEYRELNPGDSSAVVPSFVIQRSWLFNYVLPLTLFFLFIFYGKVLQGNQSSFFNFILLFFSFVLFFREVPSLGGRYLLVWSFISIFLLLIFSFSDLMINIFYKYLIYGVFFFSFYVGVRFELVQMSFAVLLGSPLLLTFIQESNISIRDFLALFF